MTDDFDQGQSARDCRVLSRYAKPSGAACRAADAEVRANAAGYRLSSGC